MLFALIANLIKTCQYNCYKSGWRLELFGDVYFLSTLTVWPVVTTLHYTTPHHTTPSPSDIKLEHTLAFMIELCTKSLQKLNKSTKLFTYEVITVKLINFNWL